MDSNTISSFQCPDMLGRERELRLLQQALVRAAAGQAQWVWLEGEAGLGKSRLCSVFREIAREQQAVVLTGQAILPDRELPYSPFVNLVDTVVARLPAPAEASTFECELVAAFSMVLPSLPHVQARFPNLALPAFEAGMADEQRRHWTFRQIARGLHELARRGQGPLVVILEDLHWADETSLQLLEALCWHFATAPFQSQGSPSLLVLGTYRPEDLAPESTFRQLLSPAASQRSSHTFLRLHPLTPAEHQRCVEQILRQPVSDTFLAALYARDEGNPFFLEELLGTLPGNRFSPDGPWLLNMPALPASLTESIMQRFARLPPRGRALLAYAAVIGRRFDFSLLAVLSHLEVGEIIALFKQAIRLHLLEEVMDETRTQESYQFRHALTREVLYSSMLAPERRMRHLEVTAAVERLRVFPTAASPGPGPGPEHAVQLLAEHYTLGSQPSRARPFLLLLAERAYHACAFHEACVYLDQVQASLPPDDPERLALLQRLGLICMGISDFATALIWFAQAREGYLRLQRTAQALEILSLMLLPVWFLSDRAFPRMLAEVEAGVAEGYAQAEAGQPEASLLVASSILVMYQVNRCHLQRILDMAERQQQTFNLQAHPALEAPLLMGKVARLWAQAHQPGIVIEACIAEQRQLLTFAQHAHLANEVMLGYLNLAQITIFWGRMPEAQEVVRQMLEHEQRFGTLRTGYVIGWYYYYTGQRWEEGIAFLRQRLAELQHKAVPQLLAIEGMILAHLLLGRQEEEEAYRHLQSARPMLEQSQEQMYLVWLCWGFARYYQARGEEVLAESAYERLLACWQTGEDRLSILTILLDGLIFFLQTGKEAKARTWLEQLSRLASETTNPVATAALLEAQGRMVALTESAGLALSLLRQAIAGWKQLQFRLFSARAAWHLAEILLHWTGRTSLKRQDKEEGRAEAEGLLQDALAIYEDLGMLIAQQKIQHLRDRTRLASQEKRKRTIRADKNLTMRQRDVLRLLVVYGYKDKEIANELKIKPKTVSKYMDALRGKCQVSTRTQLAQYAKEHKLVERGYLPDEE